MSNPTEKKESQIIDLNLFSGSYDFFRTTFGGYFEIVSSSLGESISHALMVDNVEVTYTDDDTTTATFTEGPPTEFFDNAKSYSGEGEEVSNSVIVPNYKYPVKFYGKSDAYKDDNFWKVYWMGGSFGDATYEGLYNEKVYDDYWFTYSLPYSTKEIAELVDGSRVTDEIQISYDYNFYLKEYQNHIEGLESELLIPNMYLIDMFQDTTATLESETDNAGRLTDESTTEARRFNSSIVNFVSLERTEGEYDAEGETYTSGLLTDKTILTNLFSSDNAQVTGRGTGKFHTAEETSEGPAGSLYELSLHQYLSSSVPLTQLSSSTTTSIKNLLENVLFDQQAIEGGSMETVGAYSDLSAEEGTRTLFPYYVKINFPTHTVGTPHLITAIEDHQYSSKILKTLKEVFNGETDSLMPLDREYVISQNYMSSSADEETDTELTVAQNTSLRTVDYLKLLTEAYENYNSVTDNFCFVGPDTLSRVIASDVNSAYRYVNSMRALQVVSDTVSMLTDEGIVDPKGMWELFDGTYREEYTSGKYNETIAYRIEKIGGAATGDSRTQKTLQNFWVFNSTDLDGEVRLCDSQIKYGEDYTYKVYAYVVSAGVKYKFSDLAITRQINYDPVEDEYCLEWYNPVTDETVTAIVPDGSDEGEFGSSTSWDISDYGAAAGFYIQWEPSLNLFEIPIYTKTLKILDNPPNQLGLDPFFLLDASQTIGYNVTYETFVEEEYPTVITAEDEILKEDYLNANDMTESNNITIESRSQARYLEVYRLSEMPTTYTDFDQNLTSTIDLILEDSIYTLSNAIFYDKINTNQKYYYVFRVLNENMIAGQLSEIYEAELINDGGYKYGMFDLLFAEDLEIDNFTNPSETFKKLVQLQPNMSQITFQDENVDYSETAESQLQLMALGVSEETIWDKTFKIRLTSKKTGRKIDLNVTYKYEHDSN